MKFKNARDVVYRFKNEQTLKKFIWEQVGHDFILNEDELDLSLWNAKIGNISTVGIFPKDLQISSSAIRLLIKHNNPKWKEYVHPEVAEYIDNL